ncbi:MAG: WG repeat-containing protein [Rikenellaceae bacterium]
MPVTSVTKILESMQNSYGLMRTLPELKLWMGERGEPFYCVGNSVVLFKIFYDNRWCAMRCYMCPPVNGALVYGDRYYAEELYIYSNDRSGYRIDVVLDEWIEGVTLKERVEGAVERGDHDELKMLADGFDVMARDLLRGEWAHGDLTMENIIVSCEGRLRLIDFDGKFIPELEGELSPELGTAAYQPPCRKITDFDARIDDYSVALISTALRVLSLRSEFYHTHSFYDGVLFDPMLIEKGGCEALERSIEIFLCHNMGFAYRVAMLLKNGELRIPPLVDIFNSVGREYPEEQELHLTMQHGLVGYSTPNGQVVIPHIYDDGLEFSEGVVMVRMGESWMVVDRRGEVLRALEGCERVKSFRGGVAKVLRKGVWEDIYRCK